MPVTIFPPRPTMEIGKPIYGATEGSVLFAGVLGILAQDNANLFYDDTLNRFGIGETTPLAKLHINTGTTTEVGQIIKGVASQSANLQEWQNSAGTILGVINKDGWLGVGKATPVKPFQVYDPSDGMELFSVSRVGSNNFITSGQTLQMLVAGSFTYTSAGFAVFKSNSQLWMRSGGNIYFQRSSDNADLMFINTTSGNVGIGTTTPYTKLQVVGDTKFGDDNTNYASFAADGELTLTGTARVTKHIHLNEENFRLGSAAPTYALIGHFPVLNFSNVTTQTVDIDFHVPEDWDSTTDMLMHIHWAPTTAAAGDVVWAYDYRSAAVGELLTGSDGNLSVTDSTNSTQDEHLKTTDVTIPAANLAFGDALGLDVYRDTSSGSDTYGAAAALIFVEIIYIANKLGEAT